MDRMQRAEEGTVPQEPQKTAGNMLKSLDDQGMYIRQVHESGKRTT